MGLPKNLKRNWRETMFSGLARGGNESHAVDLSGLNKPVEKILEIALDKSD